MNPLNKWSTRRRGCYLHNIHSNPRSQQASGSRPTPWDRVATGIGSVIFLPSLIVDVHFYVICEPENSFFFLNSSDGIPIQTRKRMDKIYARNLSSLRIAWINCIKAFSLITCNLMFSARFLSTFPVDTLFTAHKLHDVLLLLENVYVNRLCCLVLHTCSEELLLTIVPTR